MGRDDREPVGRSGAARDAAGSGDRGGSAVGPGRAGRSVSIVLRVAHERQLSAEATVIATNPRDPYMPRRLSMDCGFLFVLRRVTVGSTICSLAIFTRGGPGR